MRRSPRGNVATEDALVAQCRAIIERGSKSFSRAAAILDPRTRAAGYQLYAWCRHCDDVIDCQTLGRRSAVAFSALSPAERLGELRLRTEEALAGRPSDAIPFRALARVVAEHQIPADEPRTLLDGMAMDVAGLRYQSVDELVVYCDRVAGIVGVMGARILGVRDHATLARARSLGIAVQLTNIARDVFDDARMGRVYLPLDWLVAAGVPADRLTERPHREGLIGVVRRLLDLAEVRYAEVDRGLEHLPFRPAWSISAARVVYSRIGAVIRARGPDAWDRRASVPGWRKQVGVIQALVHTVVRRVVR